MLIDDKLLCLSKSVYAEQLQCSGISKNACVLLIAVIRLYCILARFSAFYKDKLLQI